MGTEGLINSRSAEVLQSREQLHEALFEYNPSQTIVVDNEGRIITFNKAKRESGDRLPDDGDIMFKDYAGKYDIDMHSELMGCIRTGEMRVFSEQRYVDKILCTTIAPFPGGAIVITEDVTARAEAEKELTGANEELKEKDRLQTAFVSNVSHELRTALCIFKNTISNLTAGGKTKIDKKLHASFQMADDSVGRLAQVIDDFIELSEIETGKVELVRSQIDMGPVVCEVADSMTPRAKARNIKLKTTADGELAACVDRDKLQNVLRQLLDNAIKFTEQGGRIEVRAEETGDDITVAVKDEGPGIESDNLQRVFDCFTKYEAGASAGSAGVGLGLTLAKELIEMHDGRIWVESTVGEGSTFYFTVPK